MKPEEAAWVRDNVWTAAMRKDRDGRDVCACQYGPSTWCGQGKHDRCQAGRGTPAVETHITNRRSECVFMPGLFEHSENPYAPVWLADRTCRWVCSCPCGHGEQTGLADEPDLEDDYDDEPVRPIEDVPLPPFTECEQLDLFAATNNPTPLVRTR